MTPPTARPAARRDVAPLISKEAIAARVPELAGSLETALAGTVPHLLCVLKGAMVFTADLLRAMSGDVTVDFVTVESYRGRERETPRIVAEPTAEIAGRHVVLVEDIVDTGHTLAFLRDWVSRRQAASIRTVTLLSKPARREMAIPVEQTGFEIEDRFVVGYGLDCDERYRQLPYIAILDDDSASRQP